MSAVKCLLPFHFALMIFIAFLDGFLPFTLDLVIFSDPSLARGKLFSNYARVSFHSRNREKTRKNSFNERNLIFFGRKLEHLQIRKIADGQTRESSFEWRFASSKLLALSQRSNATFYLN